MWHLIVAVRKILQNMKKSSRVADENMFEARNVDDLPIFGGDRGREQHGWSGLSLICTILQAPMSMFSCVSNPHVNGSDGVLATSEFAQTSEMNHLMVNDSMRYAILM
ncbi:hypothetical protein VNO77_19526 [Canavalia gladiata]|uniref:Uncharacterized protein n=1 Tax=Canavalia gladiata TaxID=3824 RepID=A0AAN9LMT2_CANGL